ncbi:Ig-like domain-containing protein, partial [Aquabacterium sp. A7-Y]|uniref:Ig-like domain-containing protein n=1 Tax=Aquabacterium sp. A7-Y TaxID=1349605 RepID=UPI00223D158B
VGDTTAPAVTLDAATDDAGTVTGPLSSGQASDDSTLLLSGSCEAGATVLVYDGSMLLGTATVNGTSWSYSATVTDATQHQFHVTATDAAGNTSAPTADIVVVGDMTAPTAPAQLSLTPTGGTVVADTLNASNTHLQAQAQIVAGEATGGRAELYIGSTLVATDAFIGAGDTSVNFSTSDGTPTSGELQAAITAGGVASVRLYDAAGNSVGSSVGNPTLATDYVAPSATFGGATDNVGSVTGSLSSGARTNDTSLALSGSCEAGATVHVYDGQSLLGTASVSGTTWTYTATVANGTTHHFKVTATDAAGNTSAPTSDFVITGDTAAPGATLAAANIDNTGNATVQSTETGTVYLVDSSITVNSVADITGAADDKWNSVTIGTANQATSLAATGLADGTYKAYAVDAAGNLSAASADTLSVAAASMDTATVVFDLVNGVSSSHSGRTFSSNVSYTIYVMVDSGAGTLNTSPMNEGAAAGANWGEWLGGNNLSADDRVVLVGTSGPMIGSAGMTVQGGDALPNCFFWMSGSGWAARIDNSGHLWRSSYAAADARNLWQGTGTGNMFAGRDFSTVYVQNRMTSVLQTQGLFADMGGGIPGGGIPGG